MWRLMSGSKPLTSDEADKITDAALGGLLTLTIGEGSKRPANRLRCAVDEDHVAVGCDVSYVGVVDDSCAGTADAGQEVLPSPRDRQT